MNKNFVSFLLLVSLMMLFLVSCAPSGTPDVSESNVGSDIVDDSQTVSPTNVSVKPLNGRIADFYTDDGIDSVSYTALSDYVTNKSCSDSLLALYSDSDEVISVPIVGPYLEKTSLYVCLFKKQGGVIGTKALMVGSDGTVVSELEQLLGESYIGTPFTDSYCFSVLADCMSSYPEFEIKGIVYDESGYMMVYPVGNQATSESILFYNYELLNFSLVDSFTSLKEGREKFNDYWNFRSTVISQIPIYKWTTVGLHPNGYINQYRYDDIYSSSVDASSCQYLYDFDWFLVVPLLNGAGEEGEYVLHLLYKKDKLIAELVLQQTSDGVIRLSKERVSEKNTQTDEYVGLDSIDYVKQIGELSSSNSTNIRGIGFDGEDFFVVYK